MRFNKIPAVKTRKTLYSVWCIKGLGFLLLSPSMCINSKNILYETSSLMNMPARNADRVIGINFLSSDVYITNIGSIYQYLLIYLIPNLILSISVQSSEIKSISNKIPIDRKNGSFLIKAIFDFTSPCTNQRIMINGANILIRSNERGMKKA